MAKLKLRRDLIPLADDPRSTPNVATKPAAALRGASAHVWKQEVDFRKAKRLRQPCDSVQRGVRCVGLYVYELSGIAEGSLGERPQRQPSRFPCLTQVTRERASDLSRFLMRRALSRRTARRHKSPSEINLLTGKGKPRRPAGKSGNSLEIRHFSGSESVTTP